MNIYDAIINSEGSTENEKRLAKKAKQRRYSVSRADITGTDKQTAVAIASKLGCVVIEETGADTKLFVEGSLKNVNAARLLADFSKTRALPDILKIATIVGNKIPANGKHDKIDLTSKHPVRRVKLGKHSQVTDDEYVDSVVEHMLRAI